MQQPVVLKFQARKDASVDKAFQGAEKGAEDLGTAFEKASRRSADLDRIIEEVAKASDTTRAGFDKLSDSVKNFGEEAEKAGQQAGEGLGDAEKRAKSFDSTLASLGRDFAAGLTVAAAINTISAATIELDANLRNLNTIIELSDADLAAYGEKLATLSLELKTTTGAAENARAAYDVASAGFVNASENAAVLEATLKAATAGNVEAADAAKLISGSLRAYSADASEAERFTNVFFSTVKNGITTFPELTATLGNVTSVAANAGVSIEELGAAVATATGRGQQTSTVIDGLRGAITNLQAPSQQAREEMERLGITVNETTLRQDGLLVTLQKIAQANGGSAESFKTILGDVQAFNVALALTSDGGEKFAANIRDIESNTTALSDAVAEQSKSLQSSIDQFKVAVEASAGAIGGVFIPAAKGLLDSVTSIVGGFAQLPEGVREVVTVMGALALATGGVVKASSLLLTATKAETIQLALNSTAKALNSTVTVAGTKATIANTGARIANAAAMGRQAIAAKAAGLSMTGLRTATVSATVGIGSLLIAGGALIALALEVKKATEASTKALDDYANAAGRASAKIGDAFRSTQKSVDELLKSGKTSNDLLNELAALREAGETIRKNFDDGNLSLEQRDRQLKKVALATQDLRKKAVALREEEKRRKAESDEQAKAGASAPGGIDSKAAEKAAREAQAAQEKLDREAEKARRDKLQAELSAIQVLKNRRELSTQQEIDALNKVLATVEVNANERRRIEERIAKLIGDDKLKAEKEARDKAKKAEKQDKQTAKDSAVTARQETKTAKADNAFEQDKLKLAEQAAQQELALAENLADGSIAATDRILVARERLYQYRLQALELEKQAAITNGQDKVKAEETYQQKVRNLEQKKTLEIQDELKKRYEAEKKTLQDIIDLNKPEDDGKTNLQFGLSNSASFFSIGGGDDDKRRKRKKAEQQLAELEQKERFRQLNPEAVAQAARQDQERALRAADPSGLLSGFRSTEQDKAVASSGPQTVNNNQRVVINVEGGRSLELTPEQRRQVLAVIDDAQKQDSLFGQ